MKKIILIISLLTFLLIGLNYIFPLKIYNDYSRIVYDKNGEILYTYLNKTDKWRFNSELSEINEDFIKAIIYKEDKYFYYHFGFNPIAVFKSLYLNISNFKIISGASTITMQLARLLEPKERNILNKIIELFRAFQLEIYYSKDEILNMYLELIPFGGNVEGVKSASIFFLNKKPNSLSLSESIALSLIPNNPTKYNITKSQSRINELKNYTINEYIKDGVFKIERLTDAKKEEFISNRVDRPQLAPHLSIRLLKENKRKTNIYSTIDINIQNKIEKIVKSYTLGLQREGIFNSAVFVVENKSGDVISYVGSQNYNDNKHSGQIDGIQSIRSPGSTLKPLVYLLSLESGIITPKSIILDIPHTFGDYAPMNFDKKYNGKVTTEFALAQSLNIPAVYLLNKLGTTKFIETLVKLNFQNIKKNENKLGLSVVLGGCGVTLEELVKLYYCFAKDGQFRPFNYLNTPQNFKKTTQLLNLDATQITNKLLTQLTRPDYPRGYEYAYKLPKIAWKTGTSYGRRDAWSIGFTKNYTIGVWVGNFDNQGAVNLTGASSATPLLFDIFNELDSKTIDNYSKNKIPERNICSQSGLIPSSNCSEIVNDYYIPFKSSNVECNHLEEVFVSIDDKYRYCTDCLPQRNYKIELFENIDPLLLDYYIQNQISYKKPLPHNPNCNRISDESKIIITSPIANHTYYINQNTDKIILNSILSIQASGCSWFINNVYLKSTKREEDIYFIPEKEGKYLITCTNNLGISNSIYINVKFI